MKPSNLRTRIIAALTLLAVSAFTSMSLLEVAILAPLAVGLTALIIALTLARQPP